jgi:hypothetical protein
MVPQERPERKPSAVAALVAVFGPESTLATIIQCKTAERWANGSVSSSFGSTSAAGRKDVDDDDRHNGEIDSLL